MNEPKVIEQSESATAGCVQRVVSLRFGELKYSGCDTHPHRLDLSCAKIRRVNGDPLTNADVWEVLKELADGKQANVRTEPLPPTATVDDTKNI